MTLGEMKSLLIANVGDNATSPNLATDANATLWLNAALRCVCNWADAQDQMLFQHSVLLATSGTPSDTSGYHIIYFTLASGTPNFGVSTVAPFRRLLGVMVQPAAPANAVPLQVVEFEKRETYKPTAASSTPPLCIISDGVMLLNPTNGLALRLHYIQAIPDMTADSDTPGQSSGIGRINLLPIDYHPMVVAYATIMALDSENSDSRQWAAVYESMQTNLMATLQKRRGARVEKT